MILLLLFLSGDDLDFTRCAMPHSNLEVAIYWAEGELVWCCLYMAGPKGQYSSADAAINGFNRVEE